MKGANAELSVKIIRKPNSNKIMTIGVSHHFFETRKNAQSSLKRLIFDEAMKTPLKIL